MNLKGNVKEVFESDLKIENNQITESKKTQFYQFFLNGRLKIKENFLVETVTSFNYDQKGRITSERTNHKSEKKYIFIQKILLQLL